MWHKTIPNDSPFGLYNPSKIDLVFCGIRSTSMSSSGSHSVQGVVAIVLLVDFSCCSDFFLLFLFLLLLCLFFLFFSCSCSRCTVLVLVAMVTAVLLVLCFFGICSYRCAHRLPVSIVGLVRVRVVVVVVVVVLGLGLGLGLVLVACCCCC